MGSAALVFDRTAPASTALVFGDDFVPARVDIAIAIALPALTVRVRMVKPVKATIAITLPALTVAVQAAYLTNTQRPYIAQVKTLAQVATATEGGITQPGQHAQPTNNGFATQWTEALASSSVVGILAQQADPRTVSTDATFTEGSQSRTGASATAQTGDPQWLRFFSQFQEADRQAAQRLQGRFEDGLRDRRPNIKSLFQEATRRAAVRYRGTVQPAVPVSRYWESLFQYAQVPPPGQYVLPVNPPPQPEYWGTALVFMCPPLSAPNLVFGSAQCFFVTPTAALAILPARFYMTAHTIYAQRLPDLADIPIFEATIAADSGSYCWSLSATGPANLFTLLAPVDGLPAQIRVTLDGIPWVFAVDQMSRNAIFGKTGVSLQGRSVTALIAAPYLRATTRNNTDDRTANQLAEDALSGTGVAIDWGVGSGALANGGMLDWLVPAGSWSHNGAALDAVQAIVNAAGGYLQSHRSSATLQARHPYGQRVGDNPGAPWGWASGPADVELATDALITESIARADGPDLNAVYVSGTSTGVLALVKRTGTAADKLAAMVTDPLITHADAARQRGLAILGAAGHKYNISLELPVLTGSGQPGVLDVGQLVQVNASVPWRGRVRSVSVSVRRPILRQSITLERHLDTV